MFDIKHSLHKSLSHCKSVSNIFFSTTKSGDLRRFPNVDGNGHFGHRLDQHRPIRQTCRRTRRLPQTALRISRGQDEGQNDRVEKQASVLSPIGCTREKSKLFCKRGRGGGGKRVNVRREI